VLLLAVLALPGAACAEEPAATAQAPSTASWEKGFNFTAWWHDAYASARAAESFSAMLRTGANAVGIIATQYQRSPTASDVAPDPERTPSDDSLRVAVRRAKDAGLLVRLRVVVDVEHGETRLAIAPHDVAAWFASYRRRLLHYAALAQRWGVDVLEVGAELQGLTRPENTAQWRRLIADVRVAFRGRLSYGANWTEFDQIEWWGALDEIGIDAYFPLAREETPPLGEVIASWSTFVDARERVHRYMSQIEAVHRRFHRPVVFSEVGYPSSTTALVQPWSRGHTYSAIDQQRGLTAVFAVFASRPWFRGVYIWHWYVDPDVGGRGDLDHTVQNKPAQRTVEHLFSDEREDRDAAAPHVEPEGPRRGVRLAPGS